MIPNQLMPPDALSQFQLTGRIAFLTGASGHLGHAMAEGLAVAGSHVILNGRRADRLEALSEELALSGHQVSVACFDITNETAVAEHIAQIGEKYGRLDILVNNASAGRPGTLESATTEDFAQLYRVNVTAAFQILQASLPLLKAAARLRQGTASVINIGSMYGSVSPDGSIYGKSGANSPPYYGAAKAGLIQLTRYSACALASQG